MGGLLHDDYEAKNYDSYCYCDCFIVIVAPPTHEWRTADEKADSPNGDDHQVDSTLGPLKPSLMFTKLYYFIYMMLSKFTLCLMN